MLSAVIQFSEETKNKNESHIAASIPKIYLNPISKMFSWGNDSA